MDFQEINISFYLNKDEFNLFNSFSVSNYQKGKMNENPLIGEG